MKHSIFFSKRRVLLLVSAFCGLTAAATAQEQLQMNVPYVCPDGTANIITSCATNARGGEVCTWREEKNGQLIVERFNIRSQMDGWLKVCKVQTPAKTPAQTQAVPKPAAPNVPGQALNPPYLVGFPPTDAAKRAIQGSNPVDTVARQVSALNYLSHIIMRMQMVPGRGYLDYTPDELRLMTAYGGAAYELSQAFLKTASPADAKTFETLNNRYDLDSALINQVYGLLSPATLTEFGKIDRAANAQAQARIDQQRRDAEQARTQTPVATAANGAPVRNDPGTVAARRCLELGGGDLECIAKGFTTGLDDLTGINTAALLAPPAGLRFGGTYKTDAGLTIGFDERTASIGSCGKLVADPLVYSVTKKANLLQVEIQTEPKPLVVTVGADGRLTGPAALDINGRIIVGYRTYWVEQRRVSDNTIIPGTGHEEREPI